jgi:sugar/nucleoside kinase (ribokinase family)
VVGKVGDDVWGRFIREDLRGIGVDTQLVALSEREQTSQTMILLCRGEDRRFVHTFGANRDFRASDVTDEALSGARILYVGGYLVLPGLAPEELGRLFAACRRRGIRTLLDVVIPTGYRYGGELEPVLPHTDYFLPNDDEGQFLTGERDPRRQAEALRRLGAATVVVTLGGGGVLFASEEGVWTAGHYPAQVIDQTGAGDAFCAGFITGISRGFSLAESVRYGSALGASCVQSIGCYQGVLKGPEAESFLASHPLPLQRLA